MSLYIKGLNMPKDDEWYNIVITSNGKGFVDVINKNNELTNTEPIQTVEIPTPHGRLIDGDKIQDKAYERYFNNTISSYGLFEVNRAIEDAPTILEAEE